MTAVYKVANFYCKVGLFQCVFMLRALKFSITHYFLLENCLYGLMSSYCYLLNSQLRFTDHHFSHVCYI
jgi:hypothetical protein